MDKTVVRIWMRLACVVVIALPLCSLLYLIILSGKSPWRDVWPLVGRTFCSAVFAAFAALAVGMVFALLLWERVPSRTERLMRNALYVIAGIPSMVVALAVMLAFEKSPSLIRVFFAMTLSGAPYAARYILEALESIPLNMLDARRSLGASEIRVFVDSMLPNMRHAVVMALPYVCTRAFGEVAIYSVIRPEQMFLASQLAVQPLIPLSASVAVIMSLTAMLLFDRAYVLRRGR